jgi:predicted amidohydrolase YtcJ
MRTKIVLLISLLALAGLLTQALPLSWAGVSAAPPGPSPDLPQVILYNGKVFTSDPNNLWVQAVAVKGNKIQAVGSDEAVLALAGPGTQLYNLAGRTVIPGLNDAHVHAFIPQAQQRLNTPDFAPGPGPNVQEVLDLIAAAAQTYPAGTWLSATVGTNFIEDPQANRFTLDQVSPHHPILLEVWTGHGMILNTKGLQTLNISTDADDPFGGFYERAPGTNVLNGVVHEYAEHLIRRRLAAEISDSQIAARYQAFAQQAVRFGLTSVQDMSVGLTQARSAQILNQANPPLRWRAICFPLSPDEACESQPSSSNLVTASGIKWIADGTPIERLAFLTEPYADLPASHGRFNFPLAGFRAMLEQGLSGPREIRQLLFHLVGDASVERLLDEMTALAPAAHWKGRRTRVEHGDLLFPAEFQRARDLGLVVAQNPTHLALTGLYSQRFSPQTVAQVQPLRSLLDNGIPLALGSDAIGAPGNPFLDIMLATLHPTRPTEALTREQAVIAYTVGSAYAEFQEHKKGRLAPGQLADLAVLSQDIFTVPFFMLPGTQSVLTMMDGQIVWNVGAIQP